MKTKQVAALTVAAAAAIGLSGCSYSYNDPGVQAVVQNEGFWPGAAHTLEGCLGPSQTKNTFTSKTFKYPAHNISWAARDDGAHERGPYVVTSSSKSPAHVLVPVVVSFDLTQDCNLLMKFHQEYATKYNGWLNDDGSESDGWKNLVDFVVGQPIQSTLLRLAQDYTWQELWNNVDAITAFQTALDKELPGATKAQTGGTAFFTNFRVTVFKPEPENKGLTAAIEQTQQGVQEAQATQAKGVAEANAQKAQADAQLAAAVSQTQVALQDAKKQQAYIDGWGGPENALKHELIEKGGNPWQAPMLIGGTIGQAGR